MHYSKIGVLLILFLLLKHNGTIAQTKGYTDAGLEAFVDLPDTVCEGNYPVTVVLKNHGPNPLVSVDIAWKINNIPKPTLFWTGYLAVNSSMYVIIDSANFLPGQNHDVVAYVINPNQLVDTINHNDTIVKEQIVTIPRLNVWIGIDTLVCQGESVSFYAVANTSTVNYIWYLDGIPIGVPLSIKTYTLNTTNLTPGKHTVSIQTNDGGANLYCPGVDQLTVDVVPLPKPNLGNDTLLCEPNTITLDAGPGAHYIWSTGANTRTITVNKTGGYFVLVDGGNETRCKGTDQIYVEIVPIPIFSIGADTCARNPFLLETKPYLPAAHYIWSSTNGLTSNTSSIQTTTSGIYQVTATYKPGSGCEASAACVVNIINVDLGPDIKICTWETITLAAPAPPPGHFYSYLWLPGGETTPEIVIAGKDVGEYLYSVDVGGGCYDEILIRIIHCPNISDSFSLSPNPSKGLVDLLLLLNTPGAYDLLIQTSDGRTVFQDIVIVQDTRQQLRLDLTHIARGSYIVQVQGHEKNLTTGKKYHGVAKLVLF